jgi:hypothetical protein
VKSVLLWGGIRSGRSAGDRVPSTKDDEGLGAGETFEGGAYSAGTGSVRGVVAEPASDALGY